MIRTIIGSIIRTIKLELWVMRMKGERHYVRYDLIPMPEDTDR